VIRAALRFAGAVALVSGVLLLMDVVATLAWQEPISALLAQRAQAGLRDQLAQEQRAAGADTRALQARRLGLRAELRRLAARAAGRARPGHAIGRIELPTLGRSYVVVQGTDTAQLRKGPGHYPKTPLPGEPGTVAVAGHRTTYLAPFRTLDRLRRGDRIVMAMPYGRFVYRVRRTRVVPPAALWVTRRVGYDQLVLTACHPLYSAARRIVVFARLAGETPARSRDSSHRISAITSASDTTNTASQ